MNVEKQLAQLGLFDARVPRYTSYPTANHFSNAVDSEKHSSWVGTLQPGTEVSIYVHVPFCRRLCWFCACRTQGTQSLGPVEAYVGTLLKEIELLKRILPDGVRMSRLHLGGGTPTLLSPELLKRLTDAAFTIAQRTKTAEFSVEIDPNEIDGPRLDALAAAGMNRASIGVQDFDPEIQKVIGREQSFEVTATAVEGLRQRGITSLNTDILYGLPYQTNAKITESVQKLLSLNPDRVALYGYAHVPWMAKRQNMIPAEALPKPEERLKLFDTARQIFLWDNYAEIGIDHFAAPGDGLQVAAEKGKLRRNFQGYTDEAAVALIGLGASAISQFPQGYSQNASGTAAYQKAIRAGEMSSARGHTFISDDKLRARIIESVMCYFKVSVSQIAHEFGVARRDIDALCDRVAVAFPGMIDRTVDGIDIKPEGKPLTRMIARAFDAYEAPAGSHSIAT